MEIFSIIIMLLVGVIMIVVVIPQFEKDRNFENDLNFQRRHRGKGRKQNFTSRKK